MTELLIALLPPLPHQQWSWREVAAELAAYNYPVRIVAELDEQEFASDLDLAGAWVAHCSLDLAAVPATRHVLLVAPGDAARLIAAMGFSQRASRRHVVGYVLVDGQMPKAGLQDWPDAPVTYVGRREAALAELRGWQVLPDDDIAAALRQVAEVSV